MGLSFGIALIHGSYFSLQLILLGPRSDLTGITDCSTSNMHLCWKSFVLFLSPVLLAKLHTTEKASEILQYAQAPYWRLLFPSISTISSTAQSLSHWSLVLSVLQIALVCLYPGISHKLFPPNAILNPFWILESSRT